MRKYLTQMLDEIQANPQQALAGYKNDQILKLFFEYAFLPEKKMLLPEGTPPFKPASEPMGMTPTNLFTEMRRLYVFCRADLTPAKREGLFISMLEGVHPLEAAALIACKDQQLTKLYPKITRKLCAEAGFVTHPLIKSPPAVKNAPMEPYKPVGAIKQDGAGRWRDAKGRLMAKPTTV